LPVIVRVGFKVIEARRRVKIRVIKVRDKVTSGALGLLKLIIPAGRSILTYIPPVPIASFFSPSDSERCDSCPKIERERERERVRESDYESVCVRDRDEDKE
jgi:hypothetical protein